MDVPKIYSWATSCWRSYQRVFESSLIDSILQLTQANHFLVLRSRNAQKPGEKSTTQFKSLVVFPSRWKITYKTRNAQNYRQLARVLGEVLRLPGNFSRCIGLIDMIQHLSMDRYTGLWGVILEIQPVFSILKPSNLDHFHCLLLIMMVMTINWRTLEAFRASICCCYRCLHSMEI